MKTTINILIAIFFTLQINSTFAQGCEDDPPPPKKEKTTVTIQKPSATFFGYFQPQFENHFTDIKTNTFKFKRARFGVRGNINTDFSYYVMLEASSFVSSTGSPYILDAFITYKKYDWAKFSVGSFKQPFGLEVTTACHNLKTIDRSFVSDQLVAPQRDLGLMMLGGNKATKFNYALALMNGRGLGVTDNNTKKDFIGRASYQLFDFLSLGASFRYGYPNNNDLERTTYGVDVLAKYRNFSLQTEYIYDEGDYNRALDGGCGSTPVELGEEREGGYIMLSYKHNKWEPVFKYEYFDADTSIKKLGYQEIMTLGVNYFFNNKTRMQINYQNKIETATSIDNDALLIQFQIKI